MGLNFASTGKCVSSKDKSDNNRNKTVIAVAGNPNVGKSTLFNALTGMNQHTGNWPGKTVSVARGRVETTKNEYVLVDIPGTYSLMPHSAEEEVAGDFICFGDYKAAVAVCDATSMERNLNLALQIMEVSPQTVVCVNLLDEAERKGVKINLKELSAILGVRVVGTVARSKKTLKELLDTLDELADCDSEMHFKTEYPFILEGAINILQPLLNGFNTKMSKRWIAVKLIEGNPDIINGINQSVGFDITTDAAISEALGEIKQMLKANGIDEDGISDMVSSSFVRKAEEIAAKCVKKEQSYNDFDRKLDRILTGKRYGFLVMLALLLAVFWITVSGANYCSSAISYLFSYIERGLCYLLTRSNAPAMLQSFVIEGLFRVPSWVISVMLPPMAIFFPLFTLLEDSGYLPRVAYNLDKPFKCCGGCGKQALTLCMGFGCNAAGVIGCRIIDSKRERMLAILTNSFVPCNGRFPMIIALISMFFVTVGGIMGGVLSAAVLTVIIVLSIIMTFLSTKILSRSLFKGMPSSYILEMPPYRRPEFSSVIVRSVFDRTLFVLARSVAVAVPAGIAIWLMANLRVGESTVLLYCADLLEPAGRLIGLDGVILLAFILGFPANEIVIPIALMIYLSGNSLVDITAYSAIREILTANGWTATTAVCAVAFALFHWPCSTTVLTIKKETGSLKWALFSMVYPTAFGVVICMIISLAAKLV